MTKQEQIEEMAEELDITYTGAEEILIYLHKKGWIKPNKDIYNAGYRKTLTSDLASDTQKAFTEGYIQGCIDSMQSEREETAKELLNKFRGLLVDIGFTYMFSEDTSMIGVTLEECVGELNKMFKQYNVEVEE